LEALAALAVVLERPVLVQQGPVLDLTSVSTEEISRAWSTLEDRPQWAGIEELTVLPSNEVDRGCDPQEEARIRSWAVVELPSGRPVGRWGFGAEDLVSTHNLVAILDEKAETASWRLFLPGSEEVKVPEVTCESDLDSAEGGVARIPAWLSLDLDREGSPGAVLVKLIMGEAARRGVTLWLPNVTRRTLPFVLRLGSKIWVDGFSVPEQEYCRECNTRHPLG
ncbi:MAG: hypothetical protein K8R59_00510, partial [Thermoanaerobaculales bacterium]|nr:hypothetical protein [Thermoanaerobaculales bacterium]